MKERGGEGIVYGPSMENVPPTISLPILQHQCCLSRRPFPIVLDEASVGICGISFPEYSLPYSFFTYFLSSAPFNICSWFLFLDPSLCFYFVFFLPLHPFSVAWFFWPRVRFERVRKSLSCFYFVDTFSQLYVLNLSGEIRICCLFI